MIKKAQKEGVKQGKTWDSFWGITDKQDIEKVLWIASKKEIGGGRGTAGLI